MLINIITGENIATPSVIYLFLSTKYLYINIFVFANKVFNKCYTNISVATKSKSESDIFCTHIAPWKIPSPFASKCCTGPSRV